LRIDPVPTKSLALRRLSFIHDITAYRKLSHTLPPAELTYLRSRVKNGEVDVIEHLFKAGGPVQDSGRKGVGVRDNGVGYTWASIATTWWEKGGPPYGVVPGQGRTQPKGAAGKGLPLEVGTAVLRCANLRAIVCQLQPNEHMSDSPGRMAPDPRRQLSKIPSHHGRMGGQGKSSTSNRFC
jgi:hypothetical protein